MKYVSLFSGIEAATVAWEPLGLEPVCFAEFDEFPSAVLAERYPDVPNVGDVTKMNWKKYRDKVDLVVGGSPCQSFSIAGKREGLQGESGLMFEYIRAVREIRPRWLLWENVPGALSSENGEAFRQLLSEMDKFGYGLAWRILDAQFFGVAQRRRRLFLVGHLGAEPPAEVLFEPESMRGGYPSSREKREALAAAARRGASSAGFKFHQGAGAGNIGFGQEQSPTCTSDWHDRAVLTFAQNTDSTAVAVEPVISMADLNANTAIGYDMVGTLHVGGDAPSVCQRAPVRRSSDADAQEGGKGALVSDEVSLTLPTGNTQTLFSEEGGDMAVRRLTPLECERLQGFPDDWTKISYRGKPADECPDGPRYKAIGNSMAVPVMRWIGERIAMAEAGDIS